MTRRRNGVREALDQGGGATSSAVVGSPADAVDDETLSALEQMLANPDDRFCRPDEREGPTPSKADRCAIMRGMLAGMETLTRAGQRDLMNRLIAYFATETDDGASRAGESNRLALRDQLDQLRRDAERAWPDVGSFCQRAESLLTMLESVA